MGFFRSKREPEGPVPTIGLQLASPPEVVFKPNDNVSGTVTIDTPIPVNPSAVEVSFWGESKTWIRTSSSNNNSSGTTSTSYTHYRDHAPLFTVTLNLLEKPQQLVPGQTYSYPFNFRVPEGTGFNRSDCYKNPNDERWVSLPHQLPPTFFFGTSPDSPDNASISYGVTSRLICNGTGFGNSATQEITFQPHNPHIHLLAPNAPLCVVPFTKRFTLQSSVLSGQDPASIGFRQRMHDRFSSETPKLDFDLGIEIPDLLTTGSEFRFRASLTAIERSDKVVQIPAVRFKVEKLELLDFTFFRAARDWDCMDNMAGDPWPAKFKRAKVSSARRNQEYTIYREKKTKLNAIPSEQVVQLPEIEVLNEEKKTNQTRQGDRCEHWFSARIPGFTPPSFQSFAVSRSYRVKVRIRAEVGDKKFDYETECHVRQMGSI
ncbi:hypothetical protein BU24DRAFT_423790 [Aaosphaeria arxii CBS 175.79]|uniref:Arrestin-like N-terminal domain-containing protein n=1 Tax=Aaosphaeria arxii CBS 175.79 TaxID=1450172 RepID=A0A6A5XP21_9PLEO|nr:uncharacterized protein BU24DRAFT_423790 [Aaosphaeria arxii CBS 175.79]KAF2014892.1 hypothetical protein BU24DRAFT_423790 [Aaosphaeria arxii CBS 175.79]